MKAKSIFWSLFFILSAGLVIASQLGYLIGIELFALIATILAAAVFISSCAHLNFFGMFLPIALLVKVDFYENLLHLEKVNTWSLILAAILLSIGFSIIFKGRAYKYNFTKRIDKKDFPTENIDDNNVSSSVVFGGSTKYFNCPNLQRAQIRCSFGGLSAYFDGCTLSPEGAVIDLDLSFSGVELYIPKNWKVICNVDCFLGGLSEKNKASEPSNGEIILNGRASFSGIEIIYI